jgi:hypothetical protein
MVKNDDKFRSASAVYERPLDAHGLRETANFIGKNPHESENYAIKSAKTSHSGMGVIVSENEHGHGYDV